MVCEFFRRHSYLPVSREKSGVPTLWLDGFGSRGCLYFVFVCIRGTVTFCLATSPGINTVKSLSSNQPATLHLSFDCDCDGNPLFLFPYWLHRGPCRYEIPTSFLNISIVKLMGLEHPELHILQYVAPPSWGPGGQVSSYILSTI